MYFLIKNTSYKKLIRILNKFIMTVALREKIIEC